MEIRQLRQIQCWFDDYVQSFYGEDDYLNANIELKDKHSRRVCDEMDFLIKTLDLDTNDAILAKTIALLHDIGRFRQFTEYKTYNDPRSIDHSEMGLKVLRENNVLDGLDASDKKIIQTAVKLHNKKEIPENLDDKVRLHSELIRDADKLDIFYVVINYYRQYRDDPDSFRLELELPDNPGYSPDIIKAVANAESVDYKNLKNWNDMKILQLGWIYDINFIASLVRIKQKKYLEGVLEFLPYDEDISKLKDKLFTYIDKSITEMKPAEKTNLAG